MIDDTSLIKGIILDKERVHPGMPKTVKDAKILFKYCIINHGGGYSELFVLSENVIENYHISTYIIASYTSSSFPYLRFVSSFTNIF